MVNFSRNPSFLSGRPISFLKIWALLFIGILVLADAIVIYPVASDQSTFDASTLNIERFSIPRRVDPATSYDSVGGELISNVYEPLIFLSDKRFLPSATTNVSDWGCADLSKFEPMLAASMPTISEDRLNWAFTVRQDVRFHPWKRADGTLLANQLLTAEDVEYTFERMLIQDRLGGPSWMFSMPATGYMSFDSLDENSITTTIEPLETPGYGERLAAQLIDDFVTTSSNDVTFHFAYARPEVMIMQIFAQSWGCIVNKAFCIEHGCWNGTFYDGWSTDYRRKPSNSYSPLERYYASKSRYPASAPDLPAMCGTGPYMLSLFNSTTPEWRLDKFGNYWQGWSGKHVETVVAKTSMPWPTRKMSFLSGELDSIMVPGANAPELLQPNSLKTPISGITLYYAAPSLSITALMFNFYITVQSGLVPKVGERLIPDFFSDVHVRRAFGHALNFTEVFQEFRVDYWRPATFWIRGLVPDYENKGLAPVDFDLDTVEAELKAAGVWESGFELGLAYRVTSDINFVKLVFESIRASIQSLNERRPGLSPFTINIIGVGAEFYQWEEEDYLPMTVFGWLADFADPDNFVRPLMHQEDSVYTPYNETVDNLIELGLKLPDGDERNQTYQTLQFMYWYDTWGVPLYQYSSGFWFRDWVKGFYYNQLYPGLYFYDLYKELPPDMEPVDIDIVH